MRADNTGKHVVDAEALMCNLCSFSFCFSPPDLEMPSGHFRRAWSMDKDLDLPNSKLYIWSVSSFYFFFLPLCEKKKTPSLWTIAMRRQMKSIPPKPALSTLKQFQTGRQNRGVTIYLLCWMNAMKCVYEVGHLIKIIQHSLFESS